MKKPLIIIIIILLLGGSMGVVGFMVFGKKQPAQIGCTMEAKICPDGSAVGRSEPKCEFAPCLDVLPNTSSNALPGKNISEFVAPLDRATERVTKKPFGIYIDPATSPVQPERFRGYHTGTDFETFGDEITSDVSVHAICSGSLEVKRNAFGYGGVVVENCLSANVPISVIYGHMRLTSITAIVGEVLAAGDVIGVLGTGYSKETDSERKHLHLGIHKGSAMDIRGYVASKQELGEWIDVCQLFDCSL